MNSSQPGAAYSAVADWIGDSDPLGANASIVSWDGAKRVGSYVN